MGLPGMDMHNCLERPEKTADIKWATWLNVLFWNLNYWDSISTVAGEVEEPRRTLPRALGVAVVLVVLTYAVPLASGVALLPAGSWSSWHNGTFVKAASAAGGPIL